MPEHLDSRRAFLKTSLAATAASLALSSSLPGQDRPQPSTSRAAPPRKALPRVAAVNSIYRLRSHAYHIVGRFIHGYTRDGFHHQPPFRVVRMYNDQYPESDLSREDCPRHGIELCQTVAQALGGEKGLDVDAVLLIIEHGDYPLNEFGQILYPRYELFQQIVEVFRKSGRSVPVFCDKHLSYDHQQAAHMVATARELGFGLMAGSSLPVTWRIPQIEPPLETPFQEGLVAFGYDRGPAEIYLFHALETLQCMLERRRGGETGIKRVECLEGEAVWRAADLGRWSWRLLQAALACNPSCNVGPVRQNVKRPLAILIDYADGTRGTVLNLVEQVSDFSFAGTIAARAEPIATCFYLPNPPGARFFNPLTYNIEKFFATGRPPYPVERTLLTSTVLDLALHSLKDGSPRTGKALDIRYQPPEETGFFRGRIADAG
jgi:hypothetical protein